MKTPMQKLQFDLEVIHENQDTIEIEKVLDAIRFMHRPNEKQVIMEAHKDGFFRDNQEDTGHILRNEDELQKEAEQYYNETFNQ